MGGGTLTKELLDCFKYSPETASSSAFIHDLCDHLYVDALVHGSCAYGEKTALVKMVDCSPIAGPVILMADRGYEAFNCFAHMERKGWNYLVRIKDFDSNGIASSIPLPKEPQFDLNVDYILTRKHTNKLKALIRENPAQYRPFVT